MATTEFIQRNADWSGEIQGHHQAATVSLARALQQSVLTNYAGPGNRQATAEEARRYRAWAMRRRFIVQLATFHAQRGIQEV